ncbi:MAG: glycosyltransferase [Bacillota bacterium]|nr:glycosyltransferase [Bacillota bacterium]
MPTLSLCMIVKDEEANLPRCLGSVRGVVDEIVVVDTGSRDRTIEIARSFGARVVEWTWRNDFAAARNVSLEHATGEWILYLDGDEELVAEDRPALRELLNDTAREGFFLQETNYAGERPGFDQVNFATLRLFRNRPEYRFEGAIHEQILPEILKRGGQVEHSRVRLRHYGYLDGSIEAQEKIRRNLQIAQAEVKRRPKDSFALFNLGMEYVRLRAWEEALKINREAFLHLPDLTVQYASRLVRNLVVSLTGLKRYDEALNVLEDAIQAYPDYTDLYYQKALVYLETRDFARAAQAFRLCVEKGESAPHHISDLGVGTYRAWFGLGYAREMMGDCREALHAYEKSLQSCRFLPGSAHRMASLLLRSGLDAELVQRKMERVADLADPQALIALAVAFRDARQYTAALNCVEKGITLGAKAGFIPLKGDLLLRTGRYQEAAEVLAEAVVLNPREASSLASFAGLASLLAGDVQAAKGWWDKAFSSAGERGRVKAFRALAGGLAGKPGVSEALHPTSAERPQYGETVWLLLGFLLERQEFEVFERALGLLEPLNLSGRDRHLQLGKLYYTLGFHESAIEELSALRPEELDAEAAEMLGYLCEQRNLPGEALMFFQLALEREPDNPKRYVLLAGKASQLGEQELAREVARQGLKRFPNHGWLREVVA